MSRISSRVRDPVLFRAKALLAVDLALWLLCVPVILRLYGVPILLKRLAESKKRRTLAPIGLREHARAVTSPRIRENNICARSWPGVEVKRVTQQKFCKFPGPHYARKLDNHLRSESGQLSK